jgi:hypothetical protein
VSHEKKEEKRGEREKKSTKLVALTFPIMGKKKEKGEKREGERRDR